MSSAILNPPARQDRNDSSPPPRAASGVLARVMRFILSQVPTLLVLSALAGAAVYGHQSHWKLPKFSALAGAVPAQPDDWCEEHGVPESTCVECNPDLFPKDPDYGWCQEHGVHNCPLHHPDVAQLKDAPVITDTDFERAAWALAVNERDRNNSACGFYQKRIQFASVEAVKQAGVDVELVERQPITEAVTGSGEIVYDQTRFASLSSRVPGTVWRVESNVGARVARDDVLALVDAVEVGQLKSQLVQALAEENLRSKSLSSLNAARAAVSGQLILEAEAALVKAQADVLATEQALINLGLPVDAERLRGLSSADQMEKLRFWGIPETIRQQLDPAQTTANLLPVRAPMQGVVIARNVVAGEVIDGADVLFQLADLSRMWLILSVPLEQAHKLSPGQTVRFRPDGSQQETEGAVDWISTAADEHTRMVQVRAELRNPEGQLRNETFGTGQIILRDEPEAIVVPKEAVHQEGCCQIVFVRNKHYFDSPDSPKLFHVRTVRVGASDEKFTEIIAGVLPGEVVVTTGSDVLRSQLLKNNLGEGCTCGE